MTEFTGEIHPLAAEYPLMSEDDLDSLAQDIAAKGLQQSIVLDQHGRLIDGRNRLEACRRAEVEPIFVVKELDDDDAVDDYVESANVEKRSLSNGQKAMFRACSLARKPDNRKNGRWRRGSVDNGGSSIKNHAWIMQMKQAGLVIDVAARADALGPEYESFVKQPELVKSGATTLDAAYRVAQDFEAKSAMAEMAIHLPLIKASGLIEQISIDIEKAVESIPVIDAPLRKQERKQLEEAAKKYAAAAATIRTYLKEAK